MNSNDTTIGSEAKPLKSALRIKNGSVSDLKTLKPTWNVPSTERLCPRCKKTKPHEAFYRARGNAAHGRLTGGCGRVYKTCGTCREKQAHKRKRANKDQGDVRYQRTRTAHRRTP